MWATKNDKVAFYNSLIVPHSTFSFFLKSLNNIHKYNCLSPFGVGFFYVNFIINLNSFNYNFILLYLVK